MLDSVSEVLVFCLQETYLYVKVASVFVSEVYIVYCECLLMVVWSLLIPTHCATNQVTSAEDLCFSTQLG